MVTELKITDLLEETVTKIVITVQNPLGGEDIDIPVLPVEGEPSTLGGVMGALGSIIE